MGLERRSSVALVLAACSIMVATRASAMLAAQSEVTNTEAVQVSQDRAQDQTLELRIGDGSKWAFVNGAWSETPDGRIDCPETRATHFLAFYQPAAYADLTAEFDFMASYRETGAGDAGLILRAQDANRYYWIHFPWCGQQLRAKHFWAAISKVDDSGYIRNLALAMMPSLPSETDRWYSVRVEARGKQIRLWVDGRPGPVVEDEVLQAGRVGLAGYGGFAFRNVRIQGTQVGAPPWDESILPPRNWIHPAPDLPGGQNMPSLCRAPGGYILLAIPSEKATFLVRSSDNARTWGPPRELPAPLHGGILHTTRDGRLILQIWNPDPPSILTSESTDDGLTWSEPTPAALNCQWPAEPPKLYAYGPLLELKDGTLLRFLYGGMSTNEGQNVVTWGSIHCRAYCIRSTDGGHTWSGAYCLDQPVWVGVEAGAIPGSLDLTEPVAAETSEGRVVCFIRPVYSPWMWETWSSDGGITWTSARRGPFPGYAPCMGRTTSGVLLVAHRFPNHSINVSHDNGVTWDAGTTVDFPVWAMGALLEVEPEVMLFVYMDANREFLRAQRIRVTPEGLQPEQPADRATGLRDRMWIWGTREAPGVPALSLAAWAESDSAARAKMLGLRNVFIAGGTPLTADRALQLAAPVTQMGGHIVFELCPTEMTGRASDYARDIAAAQALARECPNLEAVLLDDLTSQQIVGRGMPPEELAEVRRLLREAAPKVALWGVVYTMNLEHPNLAQYLAHLDAINLWTWTAQDLTQLEQHLARCEQLAPDKPIILGIYMYDYGANRPMPLDLLEDQCEHALEWLKEGRIAGIVFLSITNEPNALAFVRDWIARP